MKPIWYGPFIILENIGDNAFKLDFPSYVQIYVVVNVENLRLYELPLIEDQGENVYVEICWIMKIYPPRLPWSHTNSNSYATHNLFYNQSSICGNGNSRMHT